MNDNKPANGLIHNAKQRSERTELKKQRLLSWLVDFTWTTPAIAGEVMRLSSRGSINKSLSQFEKLDLIKSAHLELVHARDLRVLGITPNGLLWCDGRDDALEKMIFEPSRVALSTANHRLDVQKCRLKVNDLERLVWIAENNYPKSLLYRPDAIVSTQTKSIALELERTAKTRKRYQQIIIQHLRQINQGAYEQVHYVSTIEGFAERLERLFFSIKHLPVKGQQVVFSDELKQRFKFYSLSDWSFY
jgi:hypothetical protein